jgi:hypothetical protein
MAGLARADIPKTISYQGYLTTDTGTPVSGDKSMVFSLYTTASGGSSVWTENQSPVTVTNGVYQVILGSEQLLNLSFDVPYYLGVAVDRDPEMLPRQPLTSVPYALKAPLPPSSEVSSAVTAFSVTNNGTGKAGEFRRTNTDDIISPALSVSQSGKGSGLEVATYGDTGHGASFSLENEFSPFYALYAFSRGSGAAIVGHSDGTGPAGSFQITKTSSAGTALYVSTNGTGRAGEFRVTNSSGTKDALYVSQAGNSNAIAATVSSANGNAGNFTVSNASSSFNAVYGYHNGTGAAIKGYTIGYGSGGTFEINNSLNNSPALIASTTGTGAAISGTSISSTAVRGVSTSAYGIVGLSTNGVGIRGESTNNTAIVGIAAGANVGVDGYNTSNGTGVLGRSLSGYGVKGSTDNNIAVYGINNSTDYPAIEGWNQGTGYIFRGWSGASGARILKFYVTGAGNAWLAGNLTEASDLRLKTAIQPLENSLEKVLHLQGVSYQMKDDPAKTRKIGVIAQELEQEYPELVATDDQGMKSVAYANLTAVLIEAVKEQQQVIDHLKAELAELKKLIVR